MQVLMQVQVQVQVQMQVPVQVQMKIQFHVMCNQEKQDCYENIGRHRRHAFKFKNGKMRNQNTEDNKSSSFVLGACKCETLATLFSQIYSI